MKRVAQCFLALLFVSAATVAGPACGGNEDDAKSLCEKWNDGILTLDCVAEMTPAQQAALQHDCAALLEYERANNCFYDTSMEVCVDRLANGCEMGYPPSCMPVCE